MTSLDRTQGPAGVQPGTMPWPWLAALAAVALVFAIEAFDVAIDPPPALLPLAQWILALVEWFTVHFRFLFRAITWALTTPLHLVRMVFDWLAWPSILVLGAALGFAAKGARLAAFC